MEMSRLRSKQAGNVAISLLPSRRRIGSLPARTALDTFAYVGSFLELDSGDAAGIDRDNDELKEMVRAKGVLLARPILPSTRLDKIVFARC